MGEGLLLFKMEDQDRQEALKHWRDKIQRDHGYRASWISKKKIIYFPQVCRDNVTSRNRNEAVGLIKEFEDQVKRDQRMSKEERGACSNLLSDHLKQRLGEIAGQGPSLTDVREALRSAKGGAGLDQWSAHDVKLASAVPKMLRLVYANFSLWTSACKTLSCLKRVKLVYIPKDTKIERGAIAVLIISDEIPGC